MTGQPRKSGIMMKLLIFIPAVRRNPTGFSRRQCLASSPRLLICAATAVRSASRWERTQPTSYSLKWHCAADLLPECGELLRGCSYKPIPYRCLRQIRTASLTCGSVPHCLLLDKRLVFVARSIQNKGAGMAYDAPPLPVAMALGGELPEQGMFLVH